MTTKQLRLACMPVTMKTVAIIGSKQSKIIETIHTDASVVRHLDQSLARPVWCRDL